MRPRKEREPTICNGGDGVNIQILGTGCRKCRKLTENAQTAVAELGIDCEVVKVIDINEIVSFGVMITPAIAVDGEVKSAGKVLTVEQIKEYLT
jgi:small redox-active disulfide protein 2